MRAIDASNFLLYLWVFEHLFDRKDSRRPTARKQRANFPCEGEGGATVYLN